MIDIEMYRSRVVKREARRGVKSPDNIERDLPMKKYNSRVKMGVKFGVVDLGKFGSMPVSEVGNLDIDEEDS